MVRYPASAITSLVLSLIPLFLLTAVIFFGTELTPLLILGYLVLPVLAVVFGVYALVLVWLRGSLGVQMATFGTFLGFLYIALFPFLL